MACPGLTELAASEQYMEQLETLPHCVKSILSDQPGCKHAALVTLDKDGSKFVLAARRLGTDAR